MKKTTALGFAIGLAVLAAIGSPGTALAQTCSSGCGLQMRACLQGARTTNVACKLDCRTNSAPGDLRSCMLGCRDAFRPAKAACRNDIHDCVASCTPTTPPGGGGGGACLGDCGEALHLCAQGVLVQAKTCISGCTAGPDRLACLADCAAAAKSGAAACASDFGTCTESCTASPSGAFLQ
jgi:hypothetical protein